VPVGVSSSSSSDWSESMSLNTSPPLVSEFLTVWLVENLDYSVHCSGIHYSIAVYSVGPLGRFQIKTVGVPHHDDWNHTVED
jgi:hypothetical protein